MKKFLKGVIITLLMVCLCIGLYPAIVHAQGEDETSDAVIASQSSKKNGWTKTKDGYTRYYKNGKAVTGTNVAIENSKGKVYYYTFDENGNLQYGLVKKNGKLYCYNKTNKNGEGIYVKNRWERVDGKKYYFGKTGKAYSEGLKKVDGSYYYFQKDCSILRASWKKINGKTYYFGKNGKAKTGFCTLDGTKYYFNKKGELQKKTFVKVNGNKYYVNAKGIVQTGLTKINGYYYYFTKSGKLKKNCWVKLKSGTYFFSKSGKAFTGARKVKNSKYYYYFNKYGKLSAGTCKVNGAHHRFKKNGTPYTGWYTSKSGKKYYYKKNGTLTTGAAKIGGKLYLFNKKGVLANSDTGLVTVNGKTYYAKKDGTLTTGYKKIGDDYYYFGSNGEMYKKKWAYVDGYKFYFGENGKRLVDVDDIIGKQDNYEIIVNKATEVVTIYAKDGDNGYIIPVKAFICSPGESTPLGTFYTPRKYRWHELMGPCWGQWVTPIYEGYLFHSVYYNSYNDNNTLSTSAYNNLGTTCSHGCVRLTSGDAKWIYDNCVVGTKVTIINKSGADPFPKPTSIKLESWHTWDPTDPNMQYKCKEHGCNH
jgi:glucan-binding YG repeat protein